MVVRASVWGSEIAANSMVFMPAAPLSDTTGQMVGVNEPLSHYLQWVVGNLNLHRVWLNYSLIRWWNFTMIFIKQQPFHVRTNIWTALLATVWFCARTIEYSPHVLITLFEGYERDFDHRSARHSESNGRSVDCTKTIFQTAQPLHPWEPWQGTTTSGLKLKYTLNRT